MIALLPLFSFMGRRYRLFLRLVFLSRTAVFPPEDRAEDEDHEINPSDQHPLTPRDVNLSLSSLPLVANFQEALRVVRDHAVEFPLDTPLHHGLVVDRPHVQWSSFRFGVAHETSAEVWGHECLLQHVEGHVGDGEELARVRYGEADVGYREGREVLRAEREEFDRPATEDYSLIPRFKVWGDGLDGFRDETHDLVGVVVELERKNHFRSSQSGNGDLTYFDV